MKQAKDVFEKIGHGLELIMAVLVLAGVVVGVVHLWEPFMTLVQTDGSEASEAFLEYIGAVLEIVVGIEFFHMLCDPDVTAVLEVVMFVIARHMIVQQTSVLENLVCVVSIAIVVVLVIYLRVHKKHASDQEKQEEEKALPSNHS